MFAILCRSIILFLAVTALAAAPPASAPSPDLQKSFPEIRRQLASSDFAQREAGQKLLDALPPSQLAALRTLAKSETDPEVKARLDNRVDALELDVLIHPPAMSLHVQNADLVEVCAKLGEQLGKDVEIRAVTGTIGRGTAPSAPQPVTFNLQADHLPFWDIILKLGSQVPLDIGRSVITSSAGTRNVLSLGRAAGTRPDYRLVDSFLVNPRISGAPANGNWTLSITFNADPRVLFTQYSSQLRIAKITDQNDASVLPSLITSTSSMSTLTRPVNAWTSNATFARTPSLKAIKVLRAAVDLTVLEKETVLTVDLTKRLAPIETSRGTLTVEQNAAGALTFRFGGPGVATPSSTRYTTIRFLDQEGNTLSTSYTTSTQITIGVNAANRKPSKVELSWPESTRPFTLPVELHDIPLPASTPVPARP
jgi:hypothetical protein